MDKEGTLVQHDRGSSLESGAKGDSGLLCISLATSLPYLGLVLLPCSSHGSVLPRINSGDSRG